MAKWRGGLLGIDPNSDERGTSDRLIYPQIMNIIEWLTHYPPFIAEVAAKVEVELKGTSISAGRFSGLIDDVTLTSPLDFEPGECVGSTCAVAFSSRCKVSGTGKDDQGAMATITKEGSLFG